MPASAPRSTSVEPLAPGRFRVQFTAGAELRDKLERARVAMELAVDQARITSQRELAKRAGVSPRFLVQVEQGQGEVRPPAGIVRRRQQLGGLLPAPARAAVVAAEDVVGLGVRLGFLQRLAQRLEDDCQIADAIATALLGTLGLLGMIRRRRRSHAWVFAGKTSKLCRLATRLALPSGYPIARFPDDDWQTNFGSYLGGMPTLDSLATLACDPRRSEFFTEEFMLALELMERERIDVDAEAHQRFLEIGRGHVEAQVGIALERLFADQPADVDAVRTEPGATVLDREAVTDPFQ